MKSIVRVITVCCLLIFNATVAGANAPATNIETLTINVEFRGKQPDESVVKRVQNSVYVVAEQLLIGREQDKINSDKNIYQNIILEIADRVFTGYKVEQVNLEAKENTSINLVMSPWGKALERPMVSYEYTDISPIFQKVLLDRLNPLSLDLENIFQGMPEESIYWLNSIAKDSTSKFAKDYLNDFRLLTQGYSIIDKKLEVVVIPLGKRVKNVNVQLTSKNIPQTLLLWTKDYTANVAASLKGLPVEFVANNKELIKDILLLEINNYPAIKKYKLITNIDLDVAEDSQIILNVDLANYNFWLKANLDLGKKDSNFSGVAHVGYDLTNSVEVFTEATLYTDNMNWDIDLGIAKRIVNTKFSYARRFGDTDNMFRIEHTFDRKWAIRAEHRNKLNYNELGVSYRFHDFVSAEYIISSKRSWLRIITNL